MSASNGIAIEAVIKSDIARQNIKVVVGERRSLDDTPIAQHTKKFPNKDMMITRMYTPENT